MAAKHNPDQSPAIRALTEWLTTPQARRLLERTNAQGLGTVLRAAYLAGYRQATKEKA